MEQPHFIQKRAASCLTMSKIIPMTRATKRERHKDHDKENEEGQLACVVTRIHQRPEPLSDVEDYTTAGHPASSVQYFLPEIMSNSKLSNRSGTVNKAQQIPQVSQFWTYAAGHGGSVEHWKKLARKAELEMHLEQEQHRFDREKDLDSIHRLRCRISALEAAAQDKDVIIEKHRRKINLLKSQLGSTSKKLGKEIKYIQQSSVTKSPKKTWRKQSSLESDGAVQGFEDFTMPKGDSQFCAKDGSPDLLKKRPGKTTFATKILQLRTENFTLSKQLGQRDERLKSLFYEAEHLRKQNKEAISHRNSAISQVREAEKLFEKLEAMEPLIVRAGILKEQDLNTNSDDCSSFVVNKGTKSMENELRQRSKNDLASRISPSNNMETAIVPVDEIKVDVGKISRKQAFRKWASILNKIQSALMVFVSKVHTTSQLETNLKIERESFANLAYKLQKEVSTEMASQNINDTESLIGGDQIEGGRNDDRIGSDNHMVNFRVDKELVHKLVSAVREQKRKLLAASERVEDLKKEKISTEASLFKKQKKISELEKKIDLMESEHKILSSHFTYLQNLLGNIEGEKHNKPLPSASQSLHDQLHRQEHTLPQDTPQDKFEKTQNLVIKVEVLLDERNKMKAENMHLEMEKQELHKQFANMQDVMKIFSMGVEGKEIFSENSLSQLQEFKARKDELELFFEDSSILHKTVTKNMQALETVLTEVLEDDSNRFYGLDFVGKSFEGRNLLGKDFVKAIASMPDIITRVSALKNEQNMLESLLHKAELEKEEAECKLSEHDKYVQSTLGSHRELEDMKTTLRHIYVVMSPDDPDIIESESGKDISDDKQLCPAIIHRLDRMKTKLQETIADNLVYLKQIEKLEMDVSSTQTLVMDALTSTRILKQDMLKEVASTINGLGDRSLQNSVFSGDKGDTELLKETGDSESHLYEHFLILRDCLEDIQKLRNIERTKMSEEVLKLKEELEISKERLEEHAKKSENTNDWNEKITLLTEVISGLKQEKEALSTELFTSRTNLEEVQSLLQRCQEEGKTQVAVLEDEKIKLNQERDALTLDVESLRLQIHEQNVLSENSRKELCKKVETLEEQISKTHADHADSTGTANELRKLIQENEKSYERTVKEWGEKTQTLQKELLKIQHEKDGLGSEVASLKNEVNDKERTIENLEKLRNETIQSLQQELALISQERSGSSGEILDLRRLIKEQELAAEDLKSEYGKEIEILQEKISKVQQEKSRLVADLEHLQKVVSESEASSAKCQAENKQKLEALNKEVLRLGGYDIADVVERARHHTAAQKVKEFTSRVVLSDPQQPIQEENQIKKLALNPLKKLALFQVDLLVNNKAHKQLEVSGTMGGLYQAAIHYFSIDPQLGEITFENGNLPGSQSSNMLAELMLLAGNAGPVYETKAGDILGLSVKVKSLNDKNPREILYNTNVIRTDEVMEAIKGQPIDNFSLWPDLVSSWKWERSANKGWALICIKWRFLFKNIFPEISEALQVLAIMQGAHS